jgi:hypothetical protein
MGWSAPLKSTVGDPTLLDSLRISWFKLRLNLASLAAGRGRVVFSGWLRKQEGEQDGLLGAKLRTWNARCALTLHSTRT